MREKTLFQYSCFSCAFFIISCSLHDHFFWVIHGIVSEGVIVIDSHFYGRCSLPPPPPFAVPPWCPPKPLRLRKLACCKLISRPCIGLDVQAMFSRPIPGLSCQLNAWVTALTCQWLMGPCKVNDVEKPDGTILRAHGVHIERQASLTLKAQAKACTAIKRRL